MAFYSDELIDEIRDKNDIYDVISQYVGLKKKGGTYFGLCPFHNEKTPSFSVTPSKQMFYCFGCGEGGNVFSFLQKYDNISFPEAVEQLANRAGIELPKREMTAEEKRRADKRTKLFEINKEAATYFYKMLRSDHGKRAYEYFKGRQLSDETIKNFGLGYSDQYSDDLYKYFKGKGYSDEFLSESGLCTIDEKNGGRDKFWNRAMFPIMDQNGKVIAFGGRVMGEGEPKYLNSPETMIFNKSRTLFGLYLAKKTKREELILCEGYMDVISLHQAGFDNACASLGTALTEGHAGIIKRYTKKVLLCYDSDGAGRKAALRAIPILKNAGISCKVINMQPHKDPDEFIKALGAEAFEERIKNAENGFMFRVRSAEEKHDLKDPDERKQFQDEIADMLLEFSEEIERDNYINAVEERYHFGIEPLKKLVARRAQKGGIIKEERTEIPKRKANVNENISERLLITWLSERPELYPMIKKYVLPEHYPEGIWAEIATLLYAQLDETGKPEPAKIMQSFTEEEEHREVARIFNTTVGEFPDEEAFQRALKESIIRVRQNAMERERKNMDPRDMEGLKRIVEEKKFIDEMKRGLYNG